jgi:hypothetical protein
MSSQPSTRGPTRSRELQVSEVSERAFPRSQQGGDGDRERLVTRARSHAGRGRLGLGLWAPGPTTDAKPAPQNARGASGTNLGNRLFVSRQHSRNVCAIQRQGGYFGPWNFALASRRSDPDHHPDRASLSLKSIPAFKSAPDRDRPKSFSWFRFAIGDWKR